MKKQRIKYLLTVICMLAAGICYSCGRETNQMDLDGRVLTAKLEERQTESGKNVQDGLISAETETGETVSPEPGTESGSPAQPQPWQTESVRFYVHICGEVREPGVYALLPGSRIYQAVEAAGGFTEAAAQDYLNMAMETVDGMKITVPSVEEADMARDAENQSEQTERAGGLAGSRDSMAAGREEPWIRMPGGGDETSGGQVQAVSGKVNLNTADREELMTLRGIGESKAQAIIRYREEQGPFRTIEEVMNISGIKEAAFEKIKDDITV